MTDLFMGIPGVGEVYPGTHVCALFSGPVERDRLIVQFMQEGLRHGDQCVCLIDELEPVSMRQRAFEPAGHGDTRRSGSLSLHPAPDSSLRAEAFSPKRRNSSLVSGSVPTDHKPPLLRAAGQMSPAQHETGAREFTLYESAVILILAEMPAVFLCLYDMQRFGVGMLADVLKVHSRVLIDGTVLDNPHCVDPPRSREAKTGTLVRHSRTGASSTGGASPWQCLTVAEVRIAELVGTGMTNRATADELIVSPHTVDAHLKHIYQKLGIHSRAELAVLSFRHGSPTA